MDVLRPALDEFGDLWPDPVIAEMKVHAARAYGQLVAKREGACTRR